MLKLNDMKNSALDQLCTSLFSSTTGGVGGNPNPAGQTNPLQMFGLFDAYGAAASVPIYGGLSRVTYPAWAGTALGPAGAGSLTRAGILRQILSLVRA